MLANVSVTIENWHLYMFTKVLVGIMLLQWERKYVELQWHQIIHRLAFHCTFNPEWGILKGLVALPMWLIWGSRFGNAFFYRFMPVRTGNASIKTPNCPVCHDTGIVRERVWKSGRQCSCQVSKRWLDELRHNNQL